MIPVVATQALQWGTMSQLDALRHSPLFARVPEEALRDTARVVIERHFAPGTLLLEQDVQGDTLHLLVEGSVRVTRVSVLGRERILGDLYAPSVVGETAVLDQGERSASVRAMTPVRTLMLHREHFEQLLHRHPRLLWNLTVMLAKRVTSLNDELIVLGQNTQAALAHVFAGMYAQRSAAGVADAHLLPLSTTDVMARVSASRETVTRVLRRMEQQGLVKMTPAGVQLLEPLALEALSLETDDPD